MLRSLKDGLRRGLAVMGVGIHRLPNQSVPFETFASLVAAYERQLRETGIPLPENEMRPALLARLLGTRPGEAYFIIHALAQSEAVVGDVCEFGVAQGETSALIASEVRHTEKTLHLFDSFEGLPEPSEKDQLKDDIFSLGSMEAYAGTMSYAEEMVRNRLRAISFPPERFIIYKGFIEKVLHGCHTLPGSVSFAYVDFDFYEPIGVALAFLHGVTRIGSVIIVDDYDYFSTGAKAAVDEFLRETSSDEPQYELLVPDTQYGHFAVLTRTR